jgi:hypothetical protein
MVCDNRGPSSLRRPTAANEGPQKANDDKRCTRRVGGDNKKGPNDARRVVWALGTCFFFCVLFYIYYLMFYIYLGFHYIRGGLGWATSTKKVYAEGWVGGNNKNGPKRRQMRRLGSRYVFYYLACFFIYTN